jgi:hypothetical protein
MENQMKALLKIGAVLVVFGLVLSVFGMMVIRAHAIPDPVAKVTQVGEPKVVPPVK